MRLTPYQAHVIKNTAEEVYGAGTEVYLFGSRAQPDLKGGDIDLYIIPKDNNNSLAKKFQLAAQLQLQLGEQKIDLIIASDPTRRIEQEAMKTGKKIA